MTTRGACSPDPGSPGDRTLRAYDAAAELYRQQTASTTPAMLAHLDDLAARLGAGTVLELGSGPGRDADHLERRGLRVVRSDATPAFLRMLHAQGHAALQLDARRDELGGPYDAVMANAVLLHLTRPEFAAALERARRAVRDGGLLAVTLKEGDGEGWTSAKLGLPRHYTYWRAPDLRAALVAAGWSVLSLEHVAGRVEPWLFVLAETTLAPAG